LIYFFLLPSPSGGFLDAEKRTPNEPIVDKNELKLLAERIAEMNKAIENIAEMNKALDHLVRLVHIDDKAHLSLIVQK
jgi:hypothetical protein